MAGMLIRPNNSMNNPTTMLRIVKNIFLNRLIVLNFKDTKIEKISQKPEEYERTK
jgi:hypothetical protein